MEETFVQDNFKVAAAGDAPYATDTAPYVPDAPMKGSAAFGNTPAPVAPQAEPSVLQDVPHEDPQNFEEFGENLETDFENIRQGVGVLSAGMKARLIDTSRGGMLIQPQDAQLLGGIAVNIAQSYWNDWANPTFTKAFAPDADPGKLKFFGGAMGPADIPRALVETGIENFKKRPISTGMDVLPIGKAVEIPAKAAGKAVANTRAYKAVAQAAIEMGDKVADAIPFYNPLKDQIQFQQHLGETAVSWNRKYVDEATRHLAEMKALYDKIPESFKRHMDIISAGEMRDTAQRALMQQVPEIKAFWDKANELDGHLTGSMIATGVMTAEEKLIAKYGPYTRAMNPGMKEKDLWTPQGKRAVMAAKQSLDAQGIEPTYFGLVSQGAVRSALKSAANLFGGDKNLSRMAKKGEQALSPNQVPELQKALDTVLDQIADPKTPVEAMKALKAHANKLNAQINKRNSETPGFLRKRTQGDRVDGKHADDAFDVWATRHVEALQFMYLKDFFEDLLKNPKLRADIDNLPKGWEAFDVHDFFQRLGQSNGLPPGAIGRFLAGNGVPDPHIALPAMAARKLNGLLEDLNKGASPGIFGRLSGIQKTMALGFNLGWAVWQQVQNGYVYGFFANQGIRDIVPSMMALGLAFDKEVAEALPKWWTATDFGNQAPKMHQLQGIAKLAAVPSAITEKVFGVASAGDNFYRRAYGSYQLLRAVDKLPDAEKAVMQQAFFSGSAAKHNVIELAKNPKLAEAAGKEVERVFGKYDALTNSQRRILRANITWVNWWFHAFSIVQAMPERPIKTALLGRLLQTAPQELQDPNILTERELRRGAVQLNGMKGPNDKPMITYGSSLDLPLLTPMEVTDQLKGILTGRSEGSDDPGFPQLNPAVGMVANTFGVDAATGARLKDPRDLSVKGRAYADKDGEPLKVNRVAPVFADTIFRNVAASQAAQLREITAYPDKPAPVGYFNPARDFRGETLKAQSLTEIILGNFTKLKPIEQRVTKEEEEIMKLRERRDVMKARARRGTLQPPNSALGKMMGFNE